MLNACLIQINPADDLSALPQFCRQARQKGLAPYLLGEAESLPAAARLLVESGEVPLLDFNADFSSLLEPGREIRFLPARALADPAGLNPLPPLPPGSFIQPLFPCPSDKPLETVEDLPAWTGWRADAELALRILREPALRSGNMAALFDAIQHWPDPPRWLSIPIKETPLATTGDGPSSSLGPSSRVLAVVSFLRCEEWLHACLTSLVQQTRPPDHIVVIDDGSEVLPVALLAPFPQVTLLSTTRTIGPEKILNNIIKLTDYDAYMVQDADDWSAADRLELSLLHLAKTGAEMTGTHEFRLNLGMTRIELALYPPSVNEAMMRARAHYLLHCTGLIGRALALRIGGFQENLRLAADTDFVLRAWHRGRLVNAPAFAYFRRIRPRSLTTDPATGFKSPARTLEHRFIGIRAQRAFEAKQTGREPAVQVEQREFFHFHYHQGPALRLQPGKEFLPAGVPKTAV